jgi:uncharacterized protein (TIGR02147 family)
MTHKYREWYQQILRTHLTDRTQHNPRYSLRAFARDLAMSPSRISEILSGKQGLSVPAASLIAKRLGFTDEERSMFCDLVAASHARSLDARQEAQIRLSKPKDRDPIFENMANDTFQFIAEWYHLALLQLMRLQSFRLDHPWIAKTLNIREIEAAEGLERIQRLGMISIKKGKVKVLIDVPVFGKSTPSASIRKFHQQILEKAIQALHLQSMEKREFNTVLVCTSPKSIQVVKGMMADFARQVVAKVNQVEEQNDTVHCLSLQFFQLSDDVP